MVSHQFQLDWIDWSLITCRFRRLCNEISTCKKTLRSWNCEFERAANALKLKKYECMVEYMYFRVYDWILSEFEWLFLLVAPVPRFYLGKSANLPVNSL
jgi:hypothetical protein